MVKPGFRGRVIAPLCPVKLAQPSRLWWAAPEATDSLGGPVHTEIWALSSQNFPGLGLATHLPPLSLFLLAEGHRGWFRLLQCQRHLCFWNGQANHLNLAAPNHKHMPGTSTNTCSHQDLMYTPTHARD